ncbi:MAG: hypothetical protein E5V19_06830, partial [Mesorhizobium sp.]
IKIVARRLLGERGYETLKSRVKRPARCRAKTVAKGHHAADFTIYGVVRRSPRTAIMSRRESWNLPSEIDA